MKNPIKILFVLSISLASSGAFAGDMGPCILGGAAVGAVGVALEVKGKINPNMLGKFLIVSGGCAAGMATDGVIRAAADAQDEKDLNEPVSNNQTDEE